MDREIEEQWQITKDSYPEAVIFFEADGLFYVRGNDVAILSKEFSIACDGGWIGFGDGEARGYMTELVRRGHRVIRASADRAVEVRPESVRRKEIKRQRAKGNFLAIDPALLFGKEAIHALADDRWVRRLHLEKQLERFQQELTVGQHKALRESGEVYIYQVADDWYEIDRELTTLSWSHVLLLAKAACATRCALPCRVVEPRAWRVKHSRRESKRPVVSNTPPLGQMAFTFSEIRQ